MFLRVNIQRNELSICLVSGSPIGSWYIPYLNENDSQGSASAQYLHCGGVQTAVTQSGVTTSMYVISLQWKPPEHYDGVVNIMATIARDYAAYWSGVQSHEVQVGRTQGERGENVNTDSDTLSGDILEEGIHKIDTHTQDTPHHRGKSDSEATREHLFGEEEKTVGVTSFNIVHKDLIGDEFESEISTEK